MIKEETHVKKTNKKLALSTQTLRQLTNLDLVRVAGGKDPDSDGLTCFCSQTCTNCDTHYFSGCAGCDFTGG